MKKNSFNNLVKTLRKHGYKIHVSYEDGYKFAKIRGKSIFGGFATLNNGLTYQYIDGRICFDHVDCFDKYAKCPYSFPIPENKSQMEYVLEKLKYLATAEGFEKSNFFELKLEHNYP